jgi:FkbM family methyltransferase
MNRVFASIKEALLACGLDLRFAANTLRGHRLRLIRERKIDLVLDIGANVGHYARELRRCGYDGRIASFEPIPRAFARLQKEFAGDNRHEAISCALGSREGTFPFHVAQADVCSSLLPPSETCIAAFPFAGTEQVIDVPVRRLDSLAGEIFRGGERAYLKIDVQGFEKEVLLGACDTLSRVVGLELELSLVPLYDGQAIFPEVFALMTEAGFEPIWIEAGARDRKTDHLLQIDALFARPEESRVTNPIHK